MPRSFSDNDKHYAAGKTEQRIKHRQLFPEEVSFSGRRKKTYAKNNNRAQEHFSVSPEHQIPHARLETMRFCQAVKVKEQVGGKEEQDENSAVRASGITMESGASLTCDASAFDALKNAL